MSFQQLDDNPMADEEGSVVLRNYYVRYREIAAKCGISLADESKPEKAFPTSAKGEILGIEYDLKRWTWNMDDRRWSVLVRELCKIEREKEAGMKAVEYLVDKLNYYATLVPGGKRNSSMIGNVVRRSKGRHDTRWMKFDKEILRLVKWWRISLSLSCGTNNQLILPLLIDSACSLRSLHFGILT